MKARLTVWALHVSQKFKNSWWVFLIGAIGATFEDRLTGLANDWLDTNAPRVLEFIKSRMPFFLGSEIGMKCAALCA
jgi:hypothetical protein